MCSFNVSSLFVNVQLDETIAICAVEFSFDNTIYRQINGVAMVSSLGLALAQGSYGHGKSWKNKFSWKSLEKLAKS